MLWLEIALPSHIRARHRCPSVAETGGLAGRVHLRQVQAGVLASGLTQVSRSCTEASKDKCLEEDTEGTPTSERAPRFLFLSARSLSYTPNPPPPRR